MTELHDSLDALGNGWAPDPSGEHQERYLLRGEPSSLVRDGGVESIDAYRGPTVPILTPVAPAAPASAGATGALPPPPPLLPSGPGDVVPTGGPEAAGPPPSPPPPPPLGSLAPTPPVAPGGRRRLLAIVVTAAVTAGAIGWAALPSDDARGSQEAEVSSPSTWDPRVLSLVQFVEEERQLFFVHPVAIDFLPEDEFLAALRDEDGEVAPDDATEEIEARSTEALRALGLVHGDVDVAEEAQGLFETNVLGLYRFHDERIVLRGTELTPEIESTLVHELVHALQDQHFDLEGLQPEAADAGLQTALSALIEGDATVVQRAWLLAEDPGLAAGSIVDEEDGDEEDGDEEGTPEDQPALTFFLETPYLLGSTFVRVLLAEGGPPALDAAFGRPPTSERHLVDPMAYLADTADRVVTRPTLAEGEELLTLLHPDDPAPADDQDGIGMLTWYAMLASRLDHAVAWEASSGWEGDNSVVFRRDERTCVRATVATASDGDAGRFATALSQWGEAAPDPLTTVTTAGDLVTLTTCDPGPEGRAALPTYAEALYIPTVRNELSLQLQDQLGTSFAFGACLADHVVAIAPIEVLVNGTGDEPEWIQWGAEAGEVCGPQFPDDVELIAGSDG